ncbi:MAG: hypothetical protein HYT63_03545, partial [Candidatus Yanofskybacteria bacterium]|nr:hypothetical protein [Candidatus Yanofskybacteria bacterium]
MTFESCQDDPDRTQIFLYEGQNDTIELDMIREEIQKRLKKAGTKGVNFDVFFAPAGFGDYSSNLPLVLAGEKQTSPMSAGEEILSDLKKDKKFSKLFSKIELAKPG